MEYVDEVREKQIRESREPIRVHIPKDSKKNALSKILIDYSVAIAICCLNGAVLSLYNIHIAINVVANPNYHAFCDLGAVVVCSKLFKSPYGFGFGFAVPLFGKDSVMNVSNGVYDLTLFSLTIFLTLFRDRFTAKLQIGVLLLANALSVYLSYLMYHQVQAFSLVCALIYFLNLGIIIMSLARHDYVAEYVDTPFDDDDVKPKSANGKPANGKASGAATSTAAKPKTSDLNEQPETQQQPTKPTKPTLPKKNNRRRAKRD